MAKPQTRGLWELLCIVWFWVNIHFWGRHCRIHMRRCKNLHLNFRSLVLVLFKKFLRVIFFSRLLIAPWFSQMIWTGGWRTCSRDFFAKVSGICSSTFSIFQPYFYRCWIPWNISPSVCYLVLSSCVYVHGLLCSWGLCIWTKSFYSADPNMRMTLEAVAKHSWVIGDAGQIPQYLCWCKQKSLQMGKI